MNRLKDVVLISVMAFLLLANVVQVQAEEGLNVGLTKEVDKITVTAGEIFTVKIEVENYDDNEFNNLTLMDLVDVSTFSPKNMTGTYIDTGTIYDTIEWNIPSLKPHEKKTFTYLLTAITDVEMNYTLIKAKLFDADNNIKLSNPVNMYILGEEPKNVCLINGLCEPGENYLTCPKDCSSGSKDNYCDQILDGRCDPDCAKDVDIDCTCGNNVCDEKESATTCPEDCKKEAPNLFIYGIIAIVFVSLFILLLIKLKVV